MPVSGFSLCLCPHLCLSCLCYAAPTPPTPPPPHPSSLPRVFVTGPRTAPAGKSFLPRTHGVRRPPAGPARRQGRGGKGGARGGLGTRETGARGTLRGPGEGRQAGSMRRVPQGPRRRRQARSPPRRCGRGDARTPGAVPGGSHREGGCGGGAGGGRRHLGPGEQCAPHHRAAVPMRAPTVLGTHALQCSTPGPTPAPCPGTAPRGP